MDPTYYWYVSDKFIQMKEYEYLGMIRKIKLDSDLDSTGSGVIRRTLARGKAMSRIVYDRTRKAEPSWASNHTPSAIRADVLSQLDYKRHLILV